ncbi:uncharacterized protein BO87DRAFT_400946 [Aspergillus neoniger CBS 115656]|uniref:Uncharacterized protein n=1 Tax=Aspergillus neoniger (strain CBS 115656) TaxID=1448310 RepID=A0A318Y7B1_ASPNB|nr:hypothetical protein BO87DRAFT_400946 [Aspergillus neoniger CBS 115656]PYH29784.1 hypothetical protein BO87DRAFT_400946 [Aspergillus neoniger CBS 115656]
MTTYIESSDCKRDRQLRGGGIRDKPPPYATRAAGFHVIPGEPLLRPPGQRRPADQSELVIEELADPSAVFDVDASIPTISSVNKFRSPASAIEPVSSLLLFAPLPLLPFARAVPLYSLSPLVWSAHYGFCFGKPPCPLLLRNGPVGRWPRMMMLFFPASIGRKDVFATRRRSSSHLRDLLFISSCARATAFTSVSSLVCSCISAGGRAVHLVFGASNALLAHNPFSSGSPVHPSNCSPSLGLSNGSTAIQ